MYMYVCVCIKEMYVYMYVYIHTFLVCSFLRQEAYLFIFIPSATGTLFMVR